MKRKFLLALTMILALVIMVSLTSCLEGIQIPGLQLPGQTPPAETPPEETPSTQTPTTQTKEYKFRVDYYFSEDSDLPFFSQEIVSTTGFDKAALDAMQAKALSEYGFPMDTFYTDKLCQKSYDFKEIPDSRIEGGVFNVHCKRDINKAGDNVTWKFKPLTGTLEFSLKDPAGSGEMYNYQKLEYVPWHEDKAEITDIILPEGVTSIASYAFQNCQSLPSSVKFPTTLVKIKQNAFRNTNISELILPKNLEEIETNAFWDCRKIKHITFNEKCTKVGPQAFKECTNIESLVLSDSFKEIEYGAFSKCENLASIYYMGTKEQYAKVDIGFNNPELVALSQTWFLSETDPGVAGPYWYYDKDGNIKQWSYAIWYLRNWNYKTPLDKNDSNEKSPDLIVDFVRIGNDGKAYLTDANLEFQKNIVYHGYKFDGFSLQDGSKFNESLPYYTLDKSVPLTADMRLFGRRGVNAGACGDNLKFTLAGTELTITKDNSIALSPDKDGKMWDFETNNDAPWYGKAITKVTIDSSVKYIGKFAFVNFTNNSLDYEKGFTTIRLHDGLTGINPYAFSGNNQLLYVLYEGTKAQLANVDGADELVFTSGESACRIYACADTEADLSALEEGSYWISYVDSELNNAVATWSYNNTDKTLYIGGFVEKTVSGDFISDGVLRNYTVPEDRPWHHYITLGYDVKKAVILDNIRVIGDYTIAGFSTIDEIVISERFGPKYRISATAFVGTGYYDTMLEEGVVIIGNGYKHIIKVNNAKIDASGIFVLDNNTASIADGAFEGCTAITTLVLPEGINEDIGPNSLAGLQTPGLKIFFNGDESSWNKYLSGIEAPSSTVIAGAEVYFILEKNATPENGVKYWQYNSSASTLAERYVIYTPAA